MSQKRLVPPASALMQSVRGVGYDARTALADVVDNSVSAGATTVWVRFVWRGSQSFVTVLDDGCGMNSSTIDAAMTLGSKSPTETRASHDLGRFGLGLKTASLSQCSRLAISSRARSDRQESRVWDLKVVAETNDWIVSEELSDIEQEAAEALALLESGTIVIWSCLDRMVGFAPEDDERARLDFQRIAQAVEQHLAMVFHRYLDGIRPKLRLFMQGTSDEFRIKPWDPFCTSHAATQQLPEVRRGGLSGSVVVQGFVLPHKDRFDDATFDLVGGPTGWAGQQGFYVYRNERMVVSGSWLGLGSPRKWNKDEQHKLARLRLDLPNSADMLWSVDIKKSSALPPLDLRDWLTRYAFRIRDAAREVFVHRGVRAPAAAQAAFASAWISDSDKSRYRVNRLHPVVAAILEAPGAQKTAIEHALRLLETTIPVQRIWLDVSERPEASSSARDQLDHAVVAQLAKDMIARLMAGKKLTQPEALSRLRLIEPFDQFPELIASLEK